MNEVLIKDYLFFQEGPGVRNNQYTDTGVKLLNVSNLVDGKLDLSNSSRYISNEEAYGRYKHFLCDDGDLIIASSGIKVDYFDKKIGFIKKEMLPLCMNTSTIRFKVLDKEKLDIDYFYYYLKSNHFKNQLSKNITGSAQLNFGPSHLKQMKFIICDINEQKNISNRLGIIDRAIETKNNQIQKLEELIKSQFIEIFGDPVTNNKKIDKFKLFDRCEIITGNTPSRKIDEYYGDFIEWIKSDNICENSTYLTKAKESLSKKGLEVGRFIDKGSILMTCIAGSLKSIGNVAITDRKVTFNQQINGIVPKDNNVFFMYEQFILSKEYLHMPVNMSLKGILSKNQLGNLEFIFPPIELQNKFGEIFKKIEKQKEEFEDSLKKLEEMKSALMQEYFG